MSPRSPEAVLLHVRVQPKARANAVKAYLVKKGVDASKIETFGFGKTSPIKSCPDQKDRKALNACLEPNRRVEIEGEGTAK